MNRIIIVVIALIVVIGLGYVLISATGDRQVDSFAECVERGYPVAESFPRQCTTPDGQVFAEPIGPGQDSRQPRVSSPQPNAVISSPLQVVGEAPGGWFFEADLPVRLLDAGGRQLAAVPAQAQGDWMTADYVPFQATLNFTAPGTPTGTLIIEKDNPSGLPENAGQFTVPVRFATPPVGGTPTTTLADCRPTGCSSQVCAEEEVITTCEFRPEYACYQGAKCERQSNGQCGWTPTAALSACLANPPGLNQNPVQ